MPPSFWQCLGSIMPHVHATRCSVLAVRFAPVVFMSLMLRSKVLCSRHVFRPMLTGFDVIIRTSTEVMMAFQNNHNAGFQSRSLGLFWLKTSLSLQWAELPTGDQTMVNIYSALRNTDVVYLSTTSKRQT